jgi:GNAT superfamily N-acetyltransferase
MSKMNNLRIDIKTVSDLTPELSDSIQRAHEREFRNDSMVYSSPQWYLLGYLHDELVVQVGVLQRTIAINNKPLLIAGIGFLITEPQHRGRGFATELMKQTDVFVGDELELPFSLLTCKPRLETFYSGMGRKVVNSPNVFTQPTGNRGCGGLIMIKECGGISWPEGSIDLCGLPW